MISEDFLKFFDRSSRLVERALCEIADNNLFVDYTGRFGDDEQVAFLKFNKRQV